MGSSKKQTIGYWYKLLYHAGLAKGPIDAFLEFRGGDKTAWKGALTASGTININQPNLWGGEKDQGGIVSDVDVMFGEATQAPNAYLLANLGAQVPAWRGLATLVFKGGKYGAMNPYPQKASYKIRRILQGWDGGAAWYAAKAEIELARFSLGLTDIWSYAVVPAVDGGAPGEPAAYISPSFDHSSWPTGPGGFGSGGTGAGIGVGTFIPAGEVGKGIWLRRHITVEDPELSMDLQVTIWHDDGRWLWWNGEPITLVQQPNYYLSTAVIPANKVLAENTLVLQVLDSIPGGSPSNIYAGLEITTDESALVAMNPAHALYFARTDSDLGREPTANINDASLRAAADTLHAEGFGICTTRDPAQESVEEFEGRITKLIDGSFSRDPITGLWHLDLSRGDYVLGDLPILTDDDILEFRELPSTLDNAINSVSVTYFDPERKESITTPPVQARALIQDFGTIHQTIEYPEIPTASLAARVALRELLATATPTRAFDLVCTRAPFAWRPNTYFRLQVPKRGIVDMVCIVGEKESGSLKSGAIKLKAAQDIYSMPATTFVEVEPGVDTSPSQIPLPITLQAAFEAPYIEVASALSRADLAVLPADVGYLATVAADPSLSVDYTVMVDAGAGYLQAATGDWAPTGTIVEAAGYGDTAFTVAGGSRLDEVAIGSAALWGGEIVRVDALDVVTGALTLGRGCADTVPVQHAAGERIWFYGDNEAIDQTEYTDAEAIDIKLLTNTGSQQLDLADATAIPLTFASRAARPYPPGNVRINGVSYPVALTGNPLLTIDWSHRDRVLQADQLVDTLQASIGPEAGTTYTLRLYGETNTLLRTEAGLTGTSYTWSDEEADSGLGIPGVPDSDPHWPSVVSLLHLDGTDGATSIVDQTGRSWARAGTGASLSAAQSRFGPTALRITNSSSDFNTAAGILGSSDLFTVEGWFLLLGAPFTGASNAQEHALVTQGASSANGAFGLSINHATLQLTMDFRGGTAGDGNVTGTTVVALNTWYHFAATWDGTTHRGFINGNQEYAVAKAFGWKNTGQPMRLGRMNEGAANWDRAINGYLDEVRVTRGVARYTSAFTPPSSPFPSSGSLRLNGRIRAELESVRDGLISYQRHDITVDRAGYGYQYGNYYGGP